MRRITLGKMLVVTAFFILASLAAAANQAPDKIEIFGGDRGNVPFPHADHQQRLKDCTICHSIFPQEADAMKKMKAQGTLQAKKVMNIQCIKCHKQEKRDGKPHGPLTCTTCHVKS